MVAPFWRVSASPAVVMGRDGVLCTTLWAEMFKGAVIIEASSTGVMEVPTVSNRYLLDIVSGAKGIFAGSRGILALKFASLMSSTQLILSMSVMY